MDIKGALTRKFGPLPAWGWAGIAGGGIWWYRQHTGSAASNDQQAAAATNVPSFGEAPYPEFGGSLGGGFGGGDSGGSGAGTNTGTTAGNGGAGAPPTINVYPPAPPNAPGGSTPAGKKHRPRQQKPRTQHTRHNADKGKGKQARAGATAHRNTHINRGGSRAGMALAHGASTLEKGSAAKQKPARKPGRKVTKR